MIPWHLEPWDIFVHEIQAHHLLYRVRTALLYHIFFSSPSLTSWRRETWPSLENKAGELTLLSWAIYWLFYAFFCLIAITLFKARLCFSSDISHATRTIKWRPILKVLLLLLLRSSISWRNYVKHSGRWYSFVWKC